MINSTSLSSASSAKILDKENSADILTKLCSKFGADRKSKIEHYVNSRPKSLFNNWVSWDSMPFIGILWYPQDKSMKKVGEVYESVLELDHLKLKDGRYYLVPEIFLPYFAKLLVNHGYKELYSAGEWGHGQYIKNTIGHRVISFSPDDLANVHKDTSPGEVYYFTKDLKVLLCITHECFTFVAGTKDLLREYKQLFSDWRDYLREESYMQ